MVDSTEMGPLQKKNTNETFKVVNFIAKVMNLVPSKLRFHSILKQRNFND